MELDLLTAISPIDGRYRGKAGALASYFSEFALIKYRVQVEIEYFITLCELPLPQLKSFVTNTNVWLFASGAQSKELCEKDVIDNTDIAKYMRKVLEDSHK